MTDQANAAALPELRIWCLGGFRATLDGSPVVFETDKGRALLAYLAVEANQPHRRERLAGLFWSDQPEDGALHNLRQTLGGLRKALGDELSQPGALYRPGVLYRPSFEPLLLVQRETLQLNPARSAWLDVGQFQQVLQDALCFYTGGNADPLLGRGRLNLRLLERAVDLFGGMFLEQLHLEGSPLFDEWVSAQGELYHQQAVGALELLVDIRERRGEIALARQAAARLAALIPWNESTCSHLITLCAQGGLWDAAQKQYQAFQRDLWDQLRLRPSAEMVSLFENIRQAAAKDQPLPARYPTPRHNLPVMPEPCAGRESEAVPSTALDDLSMLLADPGCRLLSLVGPDGSGKTCLALAAAHLQVGMFTDGVFFIPVEAQSGPAPLAGAIANALGLIQAVPSTAAVHSTADEAQEPYQKILEYLRDKEMLLVLDHCEKALAAQAGECMAFLADVLQQAAQVKLLVTSRTALNLRSEYVLEINKT